MAEQQSAPATKSAAPKSDTSTHTGSGGDTIASLRAENASLRQQLANAGGRVRQPEHVFQLSEGQRQELIERGATNVDGVRRTAAEVDDMLGENQSGVELGDTEPKDGLGDTPEDQERAAIRGFDYVYPSVEPGFIDPAVAGTPGINGPSADDKNR